VQAQWHPNCLKCTTCKTLLNVRSLESYEKKPYSAAHRPSASATQVADDVHIKQATCTHRTHAAHTAHAR
jgi:hypothetical protein